MLRTSNTIHRDLAPGPYTQADPGPALGQPISRASRRNLISSPFPLSTHTFPPSTRTAALGKKSTQSAPLVPPNTCRFTTARYRPLPLSAFFFSSLSLALSFFNSFDLGSCSFRLSLVLVRPRLPLAVYIRWLADRPANLSLSLSQPQPSFTSLQIDRCIVNLCLSLFYTLSSLVLGFCDVVFAIWESIGN